MEKGEFNLIKIKSDEHLDWLIKNELKRDDIPKECIPAIKKHIFMYWSEELNEGFNLLQMFNPTVSVLKKRSIKRTKEWWLSMYPPEVRVSKCLRK